LGSIVVVVVSAFVCTGVTPVSVATSIAAASIIAVNFFFIPFSFQKTKSL
jgi:hypothetical protein